MLKVRLRAEAAWHDACVVNVSPRGIGLKATDPPPRGEYVEICNGPQLIVGRVVWTKNHRFGVRAQDRLDVRSLNNVVAVAPETDREQSRHFQRRLDEQCDRSRTVARAMQFACLLLLTAAGAIGLADAVKTALSEPLATASAALHR